jgi:tetratricopeptide (TPR) repeat protein
MWHVQRLKQSLAAADIELDRPAPAEAIRGQIEGAGAALARRWDDAEGHRHLAELWIRLYRARATETLRQQFPAANSAQHWQATAPASLHRITSQWLQASNRVSWNALRAEPSVVECLPAAREHLLLSQRACPLLAEVHLRLAELTPVLENTPDADAAHVRRAAMVLPTNPTCRLRGGQLDLASGRIQEACHHWRQSLEWSDQHEREILDQARTLLTTAELVEQVLPARPQSLVRIARQRFADGNSPFQLAALLNRAERLLDEPELSEAERSYLRAEIHALRGETADALADYGRAIELNPNEILWRYHYALALVEAGQLEEALVQARWCARRDPLRNDYRQLLERIHGERLRRPGESIRPG